MIKHIVMWKFKECAEGHTKDENIAKVKAMLEALPEKIPYIRKMEVMKNVNPKETNFDAVLISEFDSLEDVASYTVHPAHKEISNFVKLVREDRSAIDYEM